MPYYFYCSDVYGWGRGKDIQSIKILYYNNPPRFFNRGTLPDPSWLRKMGWQKTRPIILGHVV